MINVKRFIQLSLVISSALLLSACNLYKGSTASSSTNTSQQTGQQSTSQTSDVVTIEETDNGFLPQQAAVKAGSKITWTNNSSITVQIASDPHPTHTGNPEITGKQFVIELSPGASTTVTVTKVGTWGFHDHLNPSVRGKVTVQ